VSEGELEDLRERFKNGQYSIDIEHKTFSMAQYNDMLASECSAAAGWLAWDDTCSSIHASVDWPAQVLYRVDHCGRAEAHVVHVQGPSRLHADSSCACTSALPLLLLLLWPCSHSSAELHLPCNDTHLLHMTHPLLLPQLPFLLLLLLL
jgi:hypothetical protein